MKKLTFIATVLVTVLFLGGCAKEASKIGKLSGTVTYPDGKAAESAVITVSTEANASKVLTTVVADATGAYTIPLENGKYYISAKYVFNSKLKSTAEDYTFVSDKEAIVTVSGETKNDIKLITKAASGTDIIEISSTGYKFDQTHSHVAFKFAYDTANAEFGGQFALFGFNSLKFDEANPANSVIDAWIDVTTIETGSPTLVDTVNKKKVGGRDGINGCIAKQGGTFGVKYNSKDTFFKDTYRPTAIISPTHKATFVSTSVAAFGDGYLAKGNLTFNGETKPSELYFHYIKGFQGKDSKGILTQYSSLAGNLVMKAKADFNIKSGHVGNTPVYITTNVQVTKAIQ